MHFAFEEGGVVLADGVLNGVVLWVVGLDQDAARKIASAGASGDLGEELEGAFGGTEVGQMERRGGADDADERDALEVVAFGEHLRANEDVDGAAREGAERFLILALGASGVTVETRDARTGEFFSKAFFQMLGAFAEKIDVFRLTLRTFFWNRLNRAAIVALEAIARLVVGHRNAAVDALDGNAAAAAHDRPGVAAAVDEDERLSFLR